MRDELERRVEDLGLKENVRFLGMVIYHSWVQELFGGRRFQDFNVQQVSHTLAKIWLQGMLAETKIAPPNRVTKSKNGSSRNHSRE